MSLNPNRLSLHRQVDYIPVQSFSGMGGPPTITILGGDASITAIGLSDDADDAQLSKVAATNRVGVSGVQPPASLGNGFPILTVLPGALNLSGLKMEAAGDDVNHFMRIPNYWDRRNDLLLRAVWTSGSGVTSDGITWKFLYSLFDGNDSALVVPSTVLDTPWVADNVLANADLQITENGLLKGGTIPDTSRWMMFLVEMDAFDAGLTENKYLLGLEIEFTPRLGRSIETEGRAFQVGQ